MPYQQEALGFEKVPVFTHPHPSSLGFRLGELNENVLRVLGVVFGVVTRGLSLTTFMVQGCVSMVV